MSRLGKMPNWQKTFVISGLLACSFTGLIYLIGHEFQIQRQILGLHGILAAHGIAAMLATLAFGTVLPFHIKAGNQSKRKRLGGFSQIAFMSMLLISGALLYYGPEEARDITIKTHWIFGLLFLIVFLFHAVIKNKNPTNHENF